MEPQPWISKVFAHDEIAGNAIFSKQKSPQEKESNSEGPARIVKSADWGAVAEGGHSGLTGSSSSSNGSNAASPKGFTLVAFNMSGRAQPKLDPQEEKIIALNKSIESLQIEQKQAMDNAIKAGEDAVQGALARGREEGRVEGEKAALEKYEKFLQTLQKNSAELFESVSEEKGKLFLEYEGQALELVSGCIHRVFDGMARDHSEVVLPLLKKAIEAMGEAASLTIKVNPQDYKMADANQNFWLPVNASLKSIRIIADDRIQKGGCFIESDSTSVSAHAEEMANRIDEELKKIFMAKLQTLRTTLVDEDSESDSTPSNPLDNNSDPLESPST